MDKQFLKIPLMANNQQKGPTSPVIPPISPVIHPINMNEMGHDIRAIKTNDLNLLGFLASNNYNWARNACLTVLQSDISTDAKKTMLTLLFNNEAILTVPAANHMIETENKELISCALGFRRNRFVLCEIIKIEKMDLFKKVMNRFTDHNIMTYAIQLNKLEFVKCIFEEFGIGYRACYTGKLLAQFTQNTAILDYFLEKQPGIFKLDRFWNEAVIFENFVMLEWGLENAKLNFESLMKLACEKEKLKSMKWLYAHMENVKREKRKGDELVCECCKKARVDAEI
jgi:hypothetical protein